MTRHVDLILKLRGEGAKRIVLGSGANRLEVEFEAKAVPVEMEPYLLPKLVRSSEQPNKDTELAKVNNNPDPALSFADIAYASSDPPSIPHIPSRVD